MIPDTSFTKRDFFNTLLSGFVAGTIVDVAFYPIDTIKFRLQSGNRFWKSRKLRGMYKGLTPAAIVGGPAGAVFFCTYEHFKGHLYAKMDTEDSVAINMISATLAEIVTCPIRVPMENAKARRLSLCERCDEHRQFIFHRQVDIYGLRKALYKGFFTRIVSHIPFAVIQVSIWDYLKLHWTDQANNDSLVSWTPVKVAVCGALASGFTAFITTPLDLAVSKAMACPLKANKEQYVLSILHDLYFERGLKGMFSGSLLRMISFTIGGALFFGTYDYSYRILEHVAGVYDEDEQGKSEEEK